MQYLKPSGKNAAYLPDVDSTRKPKLACLWLRHPVASSWATVRPWLLGKMRRGRCIHPSVTQRHRYNHPANVGFRAQLSRTWRRTLKAFACRLDP